ncbi:hypothetical protein [Pseudonocardia sp. GCM10023141]|uniref:hypothetical protein n=1 Tax=Pseudonocardia sp. GCM10023141 TaxID=3252653 RepID=UPI003620722A
MQTLMLFLMYRVLIIAAVVAGVAILATVVILLARRAGRLDDAKRMAGPLARTLGDRGGMWGTVGRTASRYLDGER